MSHDENAPRAGFTAMVDATAEDWQLIAEQMKPFQRGLADRVLDHLKLLQGDYGCHAFYCASHNVKRDELRVMVIPFTLEDLRYTNSAHRRKIES